MCFVGTEPKKANVCAADAVPDVPLFDAAPNTPKRRCTSNTPRTPTKQPKSHYVRENAQEQDAGSNACGIFMIAYLLHYFFHGGHLSAIGHIDASDLRKRLILDTMPWLEAGGKNLNPGLEYSCRATALSSEENIRAATFSAVLDRIDQGKEKNMLVGDQGKGKNMLVGEQTMTTKSFRTLLPKKKLDDDIINMFVYMLNNTPRTNANAKSVKAFTTDYMVKVDRKDDMATWFKPKAMDSDLMLFPTHMPDHWVLIFIDKQEGSVGSECSMLCAGSKDIKQKANFMFRQVLSSVQLQVPPFTPTIRDRDLSFVVDKLKLNSGRTTAASATTIDRTDLREALVFDGFTSHLDSVGGHRVREEVVHAILDYTKKNPTLINGIGEGYQLSEEGVEQYCSDMAEAGADMWGGSLEIYVECLLQKKHIAVVEHPFTIKRNDFGLRVVYPGKGGTFEVIDFILRLSESHYAALIPDLPEYQGMIHEANGLVDAKPLTINVSIGAHVVSFKAYNQPKDGSCLFHAFYFLRRARGLAQRARALVGLELKPGAFVKHYQAALSRWVLSQVTEIIVADGAGAKDFIAIPVAHTDYSDRWTAEPMDGHELHRHFFQPGACIVEVWNDGHQTFVAVDLKDLPRKVGVLPLTDYAVKSPQAQVRDALDCVKDLHTLFPEHFGLGPRHKGGEEKDMEVDQDDNPLSVLDEVISHAIPPPHMTPHDPTRHDP